MSRRSTSGSPGITVLWVLALAMLLIPDSVDAFEAPELFRAAETYRQGLIENAERRQPPLPPIGTLERRLERALDSRHWRGAIEVQEAMVGLEPDRPDLWLRLAEAWNRYDARDHQGAMAAVNAYRIATDDRARLSAISLIAPWLERRRDWQTAIAAYREWTRLDPASSAVADRFDLLRRSHGFRVLTTNVSADQERPRLCLIFSEPLANPRRTAFADYIRVTPEDPVEIVATESSLCVDGVRHGESYELNALAGLPARSGERLLETVTYALTVGDRRPQIGFRGNSYVLPRMGDGLAPLTTVNVSEVDLTLLRINDRNLINEVVAARLGNSVSAPNLQAVAETRGETVWQGSMAIDGALNRTTVTGVPFADMEATPAPGLYLLRAANADAGDAARLTAPGTQWIVVSDVGLTSFMGRNGLTIAARSLENATPLRRIELALLSRNNTVLDTTRTDRAGMAEFAAGLVRGTGGNAPAAILAYGRDGDFNLLDLTRPGFDLSDRGVSGRPAPGPLDAYLFTERGVYRPGETVHLTALLRDESAAAVEDLPLTLVVRRPDGVVSRSAVVSDQGAGGYGLAMDLAPGARTGEWTVAAHVDPAADPIGRTSFQVEDFVPIRIRVDVTPQGDALRTDAEVPFDVQADYLYGAPAADLPASAELIIRPAAAPFPDWQDYRFGLAQEEFTPHRRALDILSTDASGHSAVKVALANVPDTSHPLEGLLRVSLFDIGGRPVNASAALPVRHGDLWIGLRSLTGDRVGYRDTARFEVIALDGDGRRVAAEGLQYALVRERHDYQWYRGTRGRWDYRVVVRDDPRGGDRFQIRADQAAELSMPVEWGSYRLDVFDPDSGAATSMRVTAGWWSAPSEGDTPDRMQVVLDAETYRPGDTAQVRLTAPFAGEVLLTVASDRVLHTEAHAIPEDGATIELDVEEDWGPGAYVMATAYRPLAQAAGDPGPVRAVGLAWLGIDTSERILDVSLDVPATIAPRQPLSVPITVTGLRRGERAHVTLAAVDEGILLLTDFASPDPVDHYFGRRALGLDMRDLYGRLILGESVRGTVRSGGDGDTSDQLSGLGIRSSRTVALFSGIVALDDSGQATVQLDIPDYNGELRLMAVTWSPGAVGQTSRPLTVRDPIVSQLSLPRFLAPGDEAQIMLALHNAGGPAGGYRTELSASGPVRIAGPASSEPTLAADQRLALPFTLSAEAVGVAELELDISGPAGVAISRSWQIEVRPAQPFSTERLVGELPPDRTLVLDDGLTAPYLPGTVDLTASFSNHPNFDMPGLFRELNRYPYGCLEQSTSSTLPLLYLADVAATYDPSFGDTELRQRAQSGIDRVLGMQRSDGSFGYWSSYDRGSAWLTSYAMDLLTRARERDYRMPDAAYRQGLDFLRNYVSANRSRTGCDVGTAYALYVLARAGAADIADLRYYADTCLGRFPTAMAKGQIGAALAAYGDRRRSDGAFSEAISSVRPASMPGLARDYGSDLRDRAALIALMAEAGRPTGNLLRQAQAVADLLARDQRLSTQEQLWLLLAADALAANAGPISLSVNGQPVEPDRQPFAVHADRAALSTGMRVTNEGTGTLLRVVSVRGVPIDPQPAGGDGFRLSRAFFDLDGNRLDPTRPFVQNDLIVVAITGEATTGLEHNALVVDLLPAGFEIENASIGDGRGMEDILAQIDPTAATHTEIRDDRYVAAIDLSPHAQAFRFAYLVRAVTPGEFVLPASFVEDMYLPNYNARTAMDRITVVPAP